MQNISTRTDDFSFWYFYCCMNPNYIIKDMDYINGRHSEGHPKCLHINTNGKCNGWDAK